MPRKMIEGTRVTLAQLLAGDANAGISWNGFNLFGDQKSIDEIRRLIHVEDRAKYLQRELLDLHRQPKMPGEKCVMGPVMPETPPNTVISAVMPWFEHYDEALSVWQEFRSALAKEQGITVPASGPVMPGTPSKTVLNHIDAALNDAGHSLLPEDSVWLFAVVRGALVQEDG
jgi:hypothetical protein